MARCEFWQNDVPVVGEHGRTTGDGRYWTLEFEGETGHRLGRLHLQHGFCGYGGRGEAPLETIASAPEFCKSQHVSFDDVRR